MTCVQISFLTDLVVVSILLRIFAYLADRHEKSFLFSSIKQWNSLLLEIRTLKKRKQKSSISLNFSALRYHPFRKIVVHHQPVHFSRQLLKILNTIFCTAQVLLLCVKSCLLPLLNYLKTARRHCASDKKKIDWFLNGISLGDFDSNVVFFQERPVIYSPSLSNRFY